MRVVHLLALLVGHEERIGGHGLLLLRRRVLRVLLLLGDLGRSVGRVVHGLRHLAGWLAVDGPSVLVVLR